MDSHEFSISALILVGPRWAAGDGGKGTGFQRVWGGEVTWRSFQKVRGESSSGRQLRSLDWRTKTGS